MLIIAAMGDDSLLTNLFKSVDGNGSREQDLDGDSNMIFITLLGETEANSLRLHASGSSSHVWEWYGTLRNT